MFYDGLRLSTAGIFSFVIYDEYRRVKISNGFRIAPEGLKLEDLPRERNWGMNERKNEKKKIAVWYLKNSSGTFLLYRVFVSSPAYRIRLSFQLLRLDILAHNHNEIFTQGFEFHFSREAVGFTFTVVNSKTFVCTARNRSTE